MQGSLGSIIWTICYLTVLIGLSAYGIHRYVIIYLFLKNRRRAVVPAVTEPGKIRNIAVAGHRGVGKTSLVEALLFQAGKTTRLGSIEQGTTVADWDDDEHKRQMSLSGAQLHLDWQERKINLVDCPGDAGFQADTFAALRVVEGALVVLSAVMGV